MAKQTQFHLFLDGGAAVTIAFPTTATSMGNETTNTQVVAVNVATTTLLAPNVNRKWALILNNSGSTVFLSIGGTASTNLFLPLVSGANFRVEPDTLGKIHQGALTCWNQSGGPLNINVVEA